MAITPNPIVTDLYRVIPNAWGLGLVAYQYDTTGQTVYLANGIRTRIGQVYQGHWADQQLGDPVLVSSQELADSAWDQPFPNLLAGVGISYGKVYYLRHDGITTLLTDQPSGG